MLNRLPDYIDPLIFAERNGNFSGMIKISKLTRLSDVLLSDAGELAVELAFSKMGKVPVIAGHVKGQLVLQCQSCLQALDWNVDVTFNLGVVSSPGQINRLPEELEPFLLEEEKIMPLQIVEDELLLALPDFPRHSEPCLDYPAQVADTDNLIQDKTTQRHNPFSVLAQLKNTGDN